MPYESECPSKDFSSGSVVRTLPSSAQVPFLVGETPCALRTKNQNRKQKQYCNKFKADLKTVHIRKEKSLKEKGSECTCRIFW